jgi:SAM-dependent methyltransferase
MICRVCDSTRLEPVIDLGQQPWCNDFLTAEQCGKEPFYPLNVVFCADCATAQLDYTVRKEIMFGNHTYLSGVTRSLSEHFKNIASEVHERFSPAHKAGRVLDIGSNDGTQLTHFAALGWSVQGVESSVRTAAMAVEKGVPTLNAFFNEETAGDLDGPFDAINAAGVFFHLEELHSVTEGIRKSLAPGGVFVVQFLYMQRIVENCAFDQIYHEHLLYYNLRTLSRLLERHNLEIFDAYLASIHGGSMIAFVQHRGGSRTVTERLSALLAKEDREGANEISTYRSFFHRIEAMKAANIAALQERRARGKRIFGFGAPVKGNTLLNYFKLGPDIIECLVEKNTLRKGLYSPGMHLPIVMEDEVLTPPDTYYVLAWNFKEEILKNNTLLLEQGVEFYFPVDPKGIKP